MPGAPHHTRQLVLQPARPARYNLECGSSEKAEETIPRRERGKEGCDRLWSLSSHRNVDQEIIGSTDQIAEFVEKAASYLLQ